MVAIAMEEVSGEEVAELFMQKGLINTSKWITHALKTKLPHTEKDLQDVVNSLRMEIRGYRNKYYEDSSFREICFDGIWNTVLLGISAGIKPFRNLTDRLIPLMKKIVQTNKLLEDLVNVAEKVEQKPKFYMICFYYLILMESSYKNVKRNLYAMKQLKAGKNVIIKETLGLETDKEIESEKTLKSILPDRLKRDIYKNIRNSIAHVNFRYDDKENKMEFWDIHPKTQEFSLRPIKLTYKQFSKLLLEVNLFCEIFGFVILVLIALADIARRRS